MCACVFQGPRDPARDLCYALIGLNSCSLLKSVLHYTEDEGKRGMRSEERLGPGRRGGEGGWGAHINRVFALHLPED